MRLNILKQYRKYLLILILIIASLIRLWKLDKVPISLYSDEVDVGYQAYSILKTGKDYRGIPWPLSFHSFADFRAPLYIYSSIPTVAIFGISSYGVRLPAAIFGILGVLILYLLISEIGNYLPKDNLPTMKRLAIISSFLLAISPWHIQYSRMAFEVTELLFFLLLGLYLFFKSLKNPKLLWLSTASFGLTPWIYSTAKLFTPFLLLSLIFIWRKEIGKIPKKYIYYSIIALIIFAAPMAYSILSDKAEMRFNYISVFSDPTTSSEVDYSRLLDAEVRKQAGGGIISKVISRLVHNKYIFWGGKVVNNYLTAVSFNFLFINGDPNLRHSIEGIGEFYKIEIVGLILGLILFFTRFKNRKIKILIAFWIMIGVIPSAITRDGGNHATRLILILPPLIFLISYGIIETADLLKGNQKYVFFISYLLLLIVSFIFYQHTFWFHYPWYSERSWSYGYKEVVEIAKEYQGKFKKIIITNADDRPEIFLAAYYPYNPSVWQKGFRQMYVDGFGNLNYIDKFYFGQALGGADEIKNLYKVMDKETLYIASQREVKGNLLMEPNKVPGGLVLLKTVTYPSGEPAFYAFARSNN